MSRHLFWASLGLLVVAGALVVTRTPATPPGDVVPAATAAETAEQLKEAPEFPEKLEWLQGGPLKLADLHGRVVIVHFWTNGCINCIHNYPVYRTWQEKYDTKKVTIVGVHTPEFGWEAAARRVKKKALENDLKFPIVLDPESKVWKTWQNQYWPAIYLVDKKGRIRYRWEGELHLDTADGKRFESRIDELLAEKP